MDFDLQVINQDLSRLFAESSRRKLVDCTKWACEMLLYLPCHEDSWKEDSMEDGCPPLNQSQSRHLRMAESLMDCQEFERAAFMTNNIKHINKYTAFTHYYCKYLAGEKHRLDNLADAGDKEFLFDNEQVEALQIELKALANSPIMDPFLMYLHGLCLKQLDLLADAIDMLVLCIKQAPYIWPAWAELASIISKKDQLEPLHVPNHWLKELFLAETLQRLQLGHEALSLYSAMINTPLGACPYIIASAAIVYHSVQEMDQAVEYLSQVRTMDPYRMDHMDVYSNALFVKEKRVELAALAHHCFEVDKYSPQTCCVVANYYSIRGEHERAVLYLQRATKLDPHNSGVWTLMGLEFQELKNTPAAAMAFKNALEIDALDFRAWYGLGMMYDIMRMHFYALYYYNQAHKCRPQDSRILVALGSIYEKKSQKEDAKRCYWKAHCVGDIEGVALVKLGSLYELEDAGQAASCYSMFLKHLDQNELADAENEAICYRFLAGYYIKINKLDEAHAHAQNCLQYDSTREDGRGFLKKIAAMRNQPEDGESSAQIVETQLQNQEI